MTTDALRRVLEYLEHTKAHAQITFDGREYTVDFRNEIHAKVCAEELYAEGYSIKHNPALDGGYHYARIE